MYRYVFVVSIVLSSGIYNMKQSARVSSSHIDENKKAVIFDLNGVLVTTSMMKAAKYLGRMKVGAYFLLEGKTPHSLKELLYTVLNEYPLSNSLQLCDPYGDILPAVFCDVFKGKCTETECYVDVKNIITANRNRFSSNREYTLCLKIVDILFNPTVLASMQKVKKTTLKLLRECLKKGHEVFIISNYGKESFELLQKALPELFEGIPTENIIISAHVQAVKPHKDMYEILHDRLKVKGINPSSQSCFVVDDQEENIDGVENHSMRGILFKNARDLRRLLKFYNVL